MWYLHFIVVLLKSRTLNTLIYYQLALHLQFKNLFLQNQKAEKNFFDLYYAMLVVVKIEKKTISL